MSRPRALAAPAMLVALAALLVGQAAAADSANNTPAKPPVAAAATPTAQPVGKLVELAIDTGNSAQLRGRDAQRQLVVTGRFSSGQTRDLTRHVAYTVTPPGIVAVDSTGLATPLADGKAAIQVAADGAPPKALEVTVTNYVDDPPVNFPNQIVPIFTKLGCNSGGCHGKASGQNGFKLSLLGFEPTRGFRAPGEGRPRPAAVSGRARPEPAAAKADQRHAARRRHSGWNATRIEYRLMRRWITAGHALRQADRSRRSPASK